MRKKYIKFKRKIRNNIDKCTNKIYDSFIKPVAISEYLDGIMEHQIDLNFIMG